MGVATPWQRSSQGLLRMVHGGRSTPLARWHSALRGCHSDFQAALKQPQLPLAAAHVRQRDTEMTAVRWKAAPRQQPHDPAMGGSPGVVLVSELAFVPDRPKAGCEPYCQVVVAAVPASEVGEASRAAMRRTSAALSCFDTAAVATCAARRAASQRTRSARASEVLENCPLSGMPRASARAMVPRSCSGANARPIHSASQRCENVPYCRSPVIYFGAGVL